MSKNKSSSIREYLRFLNLKLRSGDFNAKLAFVSRLCIVVGRFAVRFIALRVHRFWLFEKVVITTVPTKSKVSKLFIMMNFFKV